MNHSGDAAEQMVRLSLEGVEVAAKITGNIAKEIVIFLLAALKNKDKNLKLKGRARLTAVLKSGKTLDIYSVRESDLRSFASGAKEYGIVYCVLRNTKNVPDGLCDIMVKAEDAPKITRLSERYRFATVDRAKIETEIVTAKTERSAGTADREAPDVNDTEKLLDDLLGTEEGKAAPKAEPGRNGQEVTGDSPLAGGAPPKTNPSAPTSGNRSNSARGTLSKPSVKGELREIAAARKAKEADAPVRDDRTLEEKPKDKPATTIHRQPPQRGGKPKSPKMKGSR